MSDCTKPQQQNINNCPKTTFPPPTPDQAMNIAKAMGMSTPCSQGSASIKVGPLGLGGGASAHFSVGCEQQSAIITAYHAYSQQLQCIMSQNIQCKSSSVKSQNKISIYNAKGADINCAISINQNANIRLIEKTNFSQESVKQVNQASSDFINNFLENVQKSKTKGDVNPQGQKSLLDAQTDVKNLQKNEQLSQTVQTALTKVFAGNEVNIINYGQINCPKGGTAITIHQDIAIDAAIATVARDLLKIASQQQNVRKFLQHNTNIQDSTQSADSSSSMKVIIIIVLIIIFLAVIGYYLYEHRAELKNPETRKVVLMKLGLYVVGALIVLFLFYWILRKINPKNWFK